MKKILILSMALITGGAAQAAFTTTNATENAMIRGLGSATNVVQTFGTGIAVKQGSAGGTGTRIGLLRLDVSGIGPGDVTAAHVNLNAKIDTADWNVYVFAVKESSEQSWDPATATWTSVEASGMFAPTHGLFNAADTSLILLGSSTVPAGTVGDYLAVEISSPALLDALNAVDDGEMTLVICSDESALNVNVKSLNAGPSVQPSLTYSMDPADVVTDIPLVADFSTIVADGGTLGNSIELAGGAVAFTIGDTARLTWELGIDGTPTYGASANWSVGFIDTNAHGAVLSLRLNGTPLWSASVDASAGGPGSNTADLGSDYRETATNLTNTAFDLKDDGERAKFELNVTKTTATEYAFVAHWKDLDGNILQTFSKSYDAAVEIENINTLSFGNRVTTGSVTGNLTNLTLDMNPVDDGGPVDPNTWSGWLDLYPGLGTATNYTDDVELDGMNNLLEFALGGDPLVEDASIYMPKQQLGDVYMNYVYRRSIEDIGVTYEVLSGTDLVAGNIANATEEAGVSGDLGDGFVSVTNRVPVDAGTVQFMQLKVQLD